MKRTNCKANFMCENELKCLYFYVEPETVLSKDDLINSAQYEISKYGYHNVKRESINVEKLS